MEHAAPGTDGLWAQARAGDAAWVQAVQALEAAGRVALLRRADAALEGPEAGRAAAAAVYRALADGFEPGDADDCRRIRHLLDAGGGMSLEALMRRTETSAADEELRHVASLVLGQWDLVRGDAASCERRYLGALRAARGRWPGLEASAYNNFARLCLQVRRDLEALILARRGSEACAANGDLTGAFYGRLVEAYVLKCLEDWPRLESLVRRLEADLPRMPAAQQPRLTYGVLGVAAALALGQGRFLEALALIGETARLGTELAEPSWSPRELHHVRAQVEAARGRPQEALAEVERGLALDAPEDDRLVDLETVGLVLEAALAHPRLPASAARWLARLESPAGRALGPGFALRAGQRVGEALQRAGGHAEEARRAFRLAAAGALARLVEVEHFALEFPEFAQPTPLEAEMLADLRRRTERSEAALRGAVARLLSDEIAAGRWPLASLAPAGGLVACCAWCGRLRNRAGLWLPLPETLRSLPADVVALTHGICPECRQAAFPGS